MKQRIVAITDINTADNNAKQKLAQKGVHGYLR